MPALIFAYHLITHSDGQPRLLLYRADHAVGTNQDLCTSLTS